MSVEDAIEATLAEWHATRGTFLSCGLCMGDYLMRVSGVDPAAPWRDKVRSQAESDEAIAAAGGNAALVRQAMKNTGWTIVDEPKRGDMVLSSVHGMEVPGIFLDPLAAFRMATGVFFTRRFKLIEAYRWAS